MGKKKFKSPFEAFTITYSRLSDRVITDVSISIGFNPHADSQPFQSFKALWDTGATKSVIKPSAVKKLGLIPTGRAFVNHAGGASETNTYIVNFKLPNNVGIAGVIVCECDDGVGEFDAIIGMDIITIGDFSITNVGKKTCMSFRTPPHCTIDFVKESIRIQFKDVKPYSPCPCGEKNKFGKPLKFSECHGKILNN
jgi:hypothetical protein